MINLVQLNVIFFCNSTKFENKHLLIHLLVWKGILIYNRNIKINYIYGNNVYKQILTSEKTISTDLILIYIRYSHIIVNF